MNQGSQKSLLLLLERLKLELVAPYWRGKGNETDSHDKYKVIQKCLWNELMFLEILPTLIV